MPVVQKNIGMDVHRIGMDVPLSFKENTTNDTIVT